MTTHTPKYYLQRSIEIAETNCKTNNGLKKIGCNGCNAGVENFNCAGLC